MEDVTGIIDMSSTILLNSYQSEKELQQISAEDPSGYLPAETLDILFIKLTSTDLYSLRLTSRVVSCALSDTAFLRYSGGAGLLVIMRWVSSLEANANQDPRQV